MWCWQYNTLIFLPLADCYSCMQRCYSIIHNSDVWRQDVTSGKPPKNPHEVCGTAWVLFQAWIIVMHVMSQARHGRTGTRIVIFAITTEHTLFNQNQKPIAIELVANLNLLRTFSSNSCCQLTPTIPLQYISKTDNQEKDFCTRVSTFECEFAQRRQCLKPV